MRLMVRSSLKQRPPHLPCPCGGEHSKNPKENPRQLQPKRTRSLRERSPHRLAKAFAALLQALPRLSHPRRSPSGLLTQPCRGGLCFARNRSRTRSSTWSRARGLFRLHLRRRIRRRRRIHGRHQRLRRCTGPDTKRTAKSNRIHTQSVAVPAAPAKASPLQTSNEAQLCRIYTPSGATTKREVTL